MVLKQTLACTGRWASGMVLRRQKPRPAPAIPFAHRQGAQRRVGWPRALARYLVNRCAASAMFPTASTSNGHRLLHAPHFRHSPA